MSRTPTASILTSSSGNGRSGSSQEPPKPAALSDGAFDLSLLRLNAPLQDGPGAHHPYGSPRDLAQRPAPEPVFDAMPKPGSIPVERLQPRFHGAVDDPLHGDLGVS